MTIDEEFDKLLKQFHKLSDRHILVAETDMSCSDIQKVVELSDRIRKAGNELVGLMKKNYDQLMRTKRYRGLLKLYGSTKDKQKRKMLADQLNEIQKQYNVTGDYCRKSMIPIGKKYGINAVFALTKAEDVWHGIEKCLYGNGKTLHFSKHGDLPCMLSNVFLYSFVLAFPLFLLSLGYLNGILIKINSIGIGAAAIIHCLTCIGKADKSSVALAIIITVLCMIAVNLIGKHLQLLTEETVDNK